MFVDLQKFLPDYCCQPDQDSEGSGKERLTILQWVAAYDRYAIASTVAGEWSFASAAAHKDVVLQVCAGSALKKRKPFLGLIYDKLARKQWERRASQNEEGFDVNEVCRKLDSDIMALAQDEHDRQIEQPQQRRRDDTQKAFSSMIMCIVFRDFGLGQDWSKLVWHMSWSLR